MNNRVFTPDVSSGMKKLVGYTPIVFIVICIISFSPKLIDLQRQHPDPGFSWFIPAFLALSLFSIWGIMLYMTVLIAKNRKITIEDNIISFQNKSLIGSWVIDNINLKNVDSIIDVEQVSGMFIGFYLPVRYKSFVFMIDNQKKIASLYGWDTETVEKILSYLKDNFKQIKFIS